ncbi:MAG TPA: Trm112 family protein [Gemmatimonadales bacterium]|jgi:hypothetical protein
MHLELTEVLRCPRPHEESYIICAPVTLDGRDVVRGGLLCPACRAEFPIIDRVAWLGIPEQPVAGAIEGAPVSALTAEAALTFLDLQGQGGVVVTVGSAGRLVPGLARALPGIGFAAINAPAGVAAEASFSLVHSPAAFPIRRQSVRAAIVGADAAGGAWLEGAAAAVLAGLRIIVEDEHAEPKGFVELMRGAGVYIGERRAG